MMTPLASSGGLQLNTKEVKFDLAMKLDTLPGTINTQHFNFTRLDFYLTIFFHQNSDAFTERSCSIAVESSYSEGVVCVRSK